jgi:hypothetical protein
MPLLNIKYYTDDPSHRKMCELYWELTDEINFKYKVSDISREFGVSSSRLSKFVNQFCEVYSTQIKCKNCNANYIYQSRSDFQNLQSSVLNGWLCDNCISEKKAQELKEKAFLEEQQRQIIRTHYAPSLKKTINIREISFEDAIGLLSIIRLAGSEDLNHIDALWTVKQPLAPTETLKYDVIRQLYQNKLIFVHPDSPVDAFKFENTVIESFYLDRVIWALPIPQNLSHPRDLVAELEKIFLNMDWPDAWYDERLIVCKKVALEECLEYLAISLTEHKFTFTPGEKTQLMFSNLLEDFAVAQIYNFIWRAAKDAAAFYMRERVAKQHAANTVVGSIQRQAERARSEGWEVKAYRRDFRCPQSMISQVLFNTALHIGDEGFNAPLK